MPHLILENKKLILFLNLKFNFMKRRGLIFNSRPIKTAVFAVLGVIILVGLIAFFLNMGKHDGAYRDGTYYEEMQLGEETAEIAVTIAEGRIAEVSMEEATEAVAVFYPLLAEVTETVGQAVIENQSAEIAVESENPHSAQAILDAVAACLEQAER